MSFIPGTVLLNDYLQRRHLAEGLSWEESSIGPPHDPLWKVICKIDGVAYGVGKAKTKREAKNKASIEAQKTLEELEKAQVAAAEGTSASGSANH
ncbi:hypothetical protein SCHPADRAFT_935025 [Schizopora paradoxa]|uniref:DRBM domain-containing protein n=1 Tax=Schizopora paradoxa TaxID=27342 RepID=A0A0H2SDZ1_9AGAM|nr:hypothetical protein SCHPADRAFT_935025 [Schizopora paradoxa]